MRSIMIGHPKLMRGIDRGELVVLFSTPITPADKWPISQMDIFHTDRGDAGNGGTL